MIYLDLEPNWSSGLTENLDFMTDVFTSRSGKEKREALRSTARRSLSFTYDTFGPNAWRNIVDKINATHGQVLAIEDPVAESPMTTLAAVSGATVLRIQNVPAWLIAGAAILVKSQLQRFEVVVQSIATAGSEYDVTLVAPTPFAVPVNTQLRRLLPGRIAETQEFRMGNDQFGSATVPFSVSPAFFDDSDIQATPNPQQNGHDVFLMRPNWSTKPGMSLRLPVEVVDYDRGSTRTFRPINFQTRIIQHNYLGKNRSEIMTIVDQFRRSKGRRGSFYAPTWMTDMLPASGVLSGSTAIRVKGSSILDAYGTDTVHRSILIVTNDGSLYPLQIASITAPAPGLSYPSAFDEGFDEGFESLDSGETMLTLASPAPATIFRRDIAMICWMPLSRFASDNLQINWRTDEVAEVSASIMSLENI